MDVIEAIKKEGFRRRLSARTISSYCFYVKKFLRYCQKEPGRVTKKDVREYMDYLSEKNVAGNTLNVALCSIRFMVEEVLFKRWKLNIKYSKIPRELPVVLTKDEVVRLIGSIGNKKHKLMISLMYSAGLRLSELIYLRVRDFELDKWIGWVRKGKGNKDRVFVVAEMLRGELERLISGLDYDSYMFNGSKCGHISKQSIYFIVKKAARLAGIKKNVHPHTLRHSFATHLIEDGYAVTDVQPLLGHNDVNTTMAYVHIASPKMLSVKSPFDTLQSGLKPSKAI